MAVTNCGYYSFCDRRVPSTGIGLNKACVIALPGVTPHWISKITSAGKCLPG